MEVYLCFHSLGVQLWDFVQLITDLSLKEAVSQHGLTKRVSAGRLLQHFYLHEWEGSFFLF